MLNRHYPTVRKYEIGLPTVIKDGLVAYDNSVGVPISCLLNGSISMSV